MNVKRNFASVLAAGSVAMAISMTTPASAFDTSGAQSFQRFVMTYMAPSASQKATIQTYVNAAVNLAANGAGKAAVKQVIVQGAKAVGVVVAAPIVDIAVGLLWPAGFAH